MNVEQETKPNTINAEDALKPVIEEALSVIPNEDAKREIVAKLSIVATFLPDAEALSRLKVIQSKVEAEHALKHLEKCNEMIKRAENALELNIKDAHRVHKAWTGLRSVFTDPINAGKKALRAALLAYDKRQKEIARAEEAKLQKKADKDAAKAGQDAPLINVEANTSGIVKRRVWRATVDSLPAFINGAAKDSFNRQFLEVKITDLQRAKTQNPGLKVPGIKFEKVAI